MSKIIGITAATPTKGGDGVNVIFADSKEALPANAPTGTLGVVPRERSESGDTTELEQQVDKHTTQIGLIAEEINTINFAIGEANGRIDDIERDHATNTGFVMMMGGLAENPENDGKVLGIKDETIVAMDAPSGGGGGTKVIDLNAFGIDIVTPALQGGGTISFDINHGEFWGSIPIDEPFVFRGYTGQAYIYCHPLGVTVVDDKVTNVDFMMVVTYGGALMRGTVKFDTSISYSRTTAYIIIEPLTIPS